jgi:long-chain acyl-CoA synthetase
MDTLVSRLADEVSQHPEKPAVRSAGVVLTYAEFWRRIQSAAQRLRAAGVHKGDRVLITDPNNAGIPILYFALHFIGAIVVPVSPDMPNLVVSSIAADCEAVCIVTDRPLAGMPCALARAGEITAPAESNTNLSPACGSGDVADILYTSGTTGKRKGVVLTQANILAAAENINAFTRTRPDDVEVVPLPLSHSFGLGRLRCLALAGHTIVLVPGVGNGIPVIRALMSSQATALAMVPAGFEILHEVTRDALAGFALRYVEIGSAPMRPQTRQWLIETLPNTRICHHYGLTEASRAAFTEYHADRHKTGSAGRASPNVEIFICDSSLQVLPPGLPGEIVVRGGMVMREYWRRPDLSEAALCALGLRTGDQGYLDGDGYLYLLGRRQDIINVGGRKVIPDEIEEALRAMRGVHDAACIGVPEPILGEQVKAYLVAERAIDLNEVTSFLRPLVEEYKIPKILEQAHSLPRTVSGKLQRAQLREQSTAKVCP